MKVFRYNIDKLNNASAEIIPDSSIQKSGKPFLMILNTNKPYSESSKALANQLMEQYQVLVIQQLTL